jgi:DNA-binding CsgD family transcriptional regulator
MGSQRDITKARYGPLQAKTLKNVLAHRIHKEFPRIGGPRIRQLCAEMILEVVGKCVRPTEHLGHGQILWLAVAADQRPARHQSMADMDLVPVILDLSIPEDIDRRIERCTVRQLRLTRALRLCHQAYRQGGLLANNDLAELLSARDSDIAVLLSAYEEQTQCVVPRRATLHDMGTALTHKRIICLKHYGEGKPADQVARETYHSLEAVDRYLGQYDRVRHCRQQGLTPEETAYTLNCRLSLVMEYLQIDREREGKDA